MNTDKQCWIAEPSEWARQLLLENNPEGSEVIVDDKGVEIKSWHVTVKDAIELREFLKHHGMTFEFDLYVLRESGPRSGPRSWRKAGLEEWYPPAKNRKNLRAATRRIMPERTVTKGRLVRGKIGRVGRTTGSKAALAGGRKKRR